MIVKGDSVRRVLISLGVPLNVVGGALVLSTGALLP